MRTGADSGRGPPPGGDVRELEVFPTGTTVLVPIEPTRPGSETGTSLSDQVHRTGLALRDAVQHAREFHARPGHRPGHAPMTTASARRGGGTDIVRPVLVDPALACELAVTGHLFARPLEHLAVELPGDARSLTWRATLMTGRHCAHPVTLHLLASPSMVVTVIELVPRRRVRRRRRGFVTAGVAAVDELARRMERARAVPAVSAGARAGRRRGRSTAAVWTG